MSRFIAIANQKGGVGKTTTTVNLAASLAQFGRRVLVLDMDPQGNASSGFGVSANSLQRGVYEVLMGSARVQEAICQQASPGVDLLPSGQRLIGAEVELVSALARERILEKAIQPIRNQYDILLADCPPSLGLLTVNTLTAADSVLIPIQCEYYALEGVTQLMNAIRLIQQALNPRLDVEGILLTMFDARLNLSREVMEEARKFFSGKVYETVIPRNVRLSEAPSFGKPVLQYDPECAGAQFYLKLAREVLGLPPAAVTSEIVEAPEVAAPESVEAEVVAPPIRNEAPLIAGETSMLPDRAIELTEVAASIAPSDATVDLSAAGNRSAGEPVVVAEEVRATAIETAADPVEVTAVQPIEVTAIETAVDPIEATAIETAVQPIEATAIETAAQPIASVHPTIEPVTSFQTSDTTSQAETFIPDPVHEHAIEEMPYAPPPIPPSFDAIVVAYTEDATVPTVETGTPTDEIIVLSEDAIVTSEDANGESSPETTIEQHLEEPRTIEDDRPLSEPTTEAHPQEELVSHD